MPVKYGVAAFLAICAIAGRAQEIPAGPVKLEINLKAGQTRTFKVVNESVLSTSVAGAEPRKTATNSTGTFELAVDSVNPDGSYAIRVRTLAGALSVGGNVVPPPEGFDAEVKATLTRDGRFRDVSGAPSLSKSGPAPMTGEDFLDTVFDKDAALPAQPVSVGATWDDKVASPVEQGDTKMTVHNALVAVDLMDATPVARVLTLICEPVQDPSPQPGVTAAGKMEGGGLVTMELSTGLALDERDALRLTMDVDAQNPADAAQKVSVHTEANIKVRVQSQPAGA
jgi:hypothetical protein